MTDLIIDTASSTPVWEQLRDQFTRYIASGQLPPGTRLPAIRQLANDLGIAPGTAARTYAELEQQRLIVSRRPQGSFVTERKATTEAAPALLARLAETFAHQARQLGAGADEAVTAVRSAFLSS